jgi:siroheme synthase (precorrin-2 oxidase/ferrochelatase)
MTVIELIFSTEIKIMVTTNTASHRLAQTYTELRDECETLLKLAEQLAAIARDKGSNFNDDADFQKLKSEFRQKLCDEVMPRVSC